MVRSKNAFQLSMAAPPLCEVLLAIPVLAVIPSSTVAEKENRRLEVDQPAPYARVPASEQQKVLAEIGKKHEED